MWRSEPGDGGSPGRVRRGQRDGGAPAPCPGGDRTPSGPLNDGPPPSCPSSAQATLLRSKWKAFGLEEDCGCSPRAVRGPPALASGVNRHCACCGTPIRHTSSDPTDRSSKFVDPGKLLSKQGHEGRSHEGNELAEFFCAGKASHKQHGKTCGACTDSRARAGSPRKYSDCNQMVGHSASDPVKREKFVDTAQFFLTYSGHEGNELTQFFCSGKKSHHKGKTSGGPPTATHPSECGDCGGRGEAADHGDPSAFMRPSEVLGHEKHSGNELTRFFCTRTPSRNQKGKSDGGSLAAGRFKHILFSARRHP